MSEQRHTRDLVVVVPGILGSVLRIPGGRDAWNASLAVASHHLWDFCEALETLRLPRDLGDGPPPGRHALEAKGLMPGWQIWPGFWSGAGYPALVNSLRTCLPDPRQQLMLFPYDWRLSNRHNARLLLDQAKQRLYEWRRDGGGPDAQLQLVCHSMGGLIGRHFLHVLGGADLTRRAYMIGTPYSGSVKAVRVLTGRLLPPPFGWFGERLREVAQTFPSVAELLPAYPCVADPGGGDGGRGTRLADHRVPGLSSRAVAASADFHTEVTRRERRAAPGLVHVFGGGWQPTEQAVVVDSAELDFARHHRGEDFSGDGTVPRFSSVPPHWTDDAQAMFYPAKHVGLTRHKEVLRHLTQKIDAVPLSAALTPGRPLSLHLPPVASAGQEVPLQVRADSPNLVLDAHLYGADGARYGRPLPLLPDDAGGYAADLALPPGIWHVVVETTKESPASRVEDLIVVAR